MRKNATRQTSKHAPMLYLFAELVKPPTEVVAVARHAFVLNEPANWKMLRKRVPKLLSVLLVNLPSPLWVRAANLAGKRNHAQLALLRAVQIKPALGVATQLLFAESLNSGNTIYATTPC